MWIKEINKMDNFLKELNRWGGIYINDEVDDDIEKFGIDEPSLN